MKKIVSIILIIMTGWISAAAQTANPFVSSNSSPSVVPVGGNSTVQVQAGNAGNDNIVANSLEITMSVGTNAEILLIGPGSDPRWTISSLIAGPGGTIQLRNTGGGFGPFDALPINILIRGVAAAAGPQNIPVNVSYLFGPNPLLGGAPSSSQGNQSILDDNGNTTLLVNPALPVVMFDISVTASSCNGIVNWKTATEANVDHFDIEFGKSMLNMTKVGTVQASNNPNGSTYRFANDQGTGKGFYRVITVDKDGTTTYSNILVADTKCSGKKTVSLYPNPLSSNESLTVIASGFEGNIKGELVSMAGQIMRTYNLKNGTNTLPVEKLAQATYMLRVSDAAGDAETFRVVIIK